MKKEVKRSFLTTLSEELISSIKNIDLKYFGSKVEDIKNKNYEIDEEKALLDLIRRATINPKKMQESINIFRVLQISFERLKIDIELRSHQRNLELIYPLDFSEIFTYLHSNRQDIKWGKFVKYFIEENNKHIFTILPGTVWEFLHFLKIISANTRDMKYDRLINNSSVQKIIKAFDKNVDNGINTYIQEGGLTDIIEFMREMKFEAFISTPIGKFISLILDKKIQPIEKLDTFEYQWAMGDKKYKEKYNAVERRLATLRPYVKPFNNRIDALNFSDTLKLNDLNSDSGYFSIIARDLTLKAFNYFPWENDPLKDRIPRDSISIGRSSHYAYYHTLIDNKIINLDEKIKFIDDCLDMLSHLNTVIPRFFGEIIKYSQLNGIEKIKKAKHLLIDEDINFFTRVYSRVLSEKELKDYDQKDFINDVEKTVQIVRDESKFQDFVAEAIDKIDLFALKIFETLSSFTDKFSESQIDPDIRDVYNWIKNIKK